MGGAAVVSSGKGGRTSLDATINLVPFIDLLSCCLAFLLITAVWVNLGRMAVAPPKSAAGVNSLLDTEPTVTRTLTTDGCVLSRSTGEQAELPRIDGQIDAQGLSRQLAMVRLALPRQHDITVRPQDAVHYADLIKTMDLAKGAQFSNIQITPSNE